MYQVALIHRPLSSLFMCLTFLYRCWFPLSLSSFLPLAASLRSSRFLSRSSSPRKDDPIVSERDYTLAPLTDSPYPREKFSLREHALVTTAAYGLPHFPSPSSLPVSAWYSRIPATSASARSRRDRGVAQPLTRMAQVLSRHCTPARLAIAATISRTREGRGASTRVARLLTTPALTAPR